MNRVGEVLLNIGLFTAYFVFIAAVLLVIFTGIRRIANNPGQSTQILVAIGIGTALMFLLFVLAPATVAGVDLAEYGLGRVTLKIIGALMFVLYVLVVVSLAAIIYTEIRRSSDV